MTRRIRPQVLSAIILLCCFTGFVAGFAFLWDLTRHPERHPSIKARLAGLEYLTNAGMTLQRGGRDCGPVALYRVFHLRGMGASLAELDRQMMDAPGGTTVARIKEIAERHGLIARARRIKEDELREVPLPSIALWREHHYLVIESIGPGDRMIVFDPAIGRCATTITRFMKQTSGAMLLLQAPVREGLAKRGSFQ